MKRRTFFGYAIGAVCGLVGLKRAKAKRVLVFREGVLAGRVGAAEIGRIAAENRDRMFIQAIKR